MKDYISLPYDLIINRRIKKNHIIILSIISISPKNDGWVSLRYKDFYDIGMLSTGSLREPLKDLIDMKILLVNNEYIKGKEGECCKYKINY